MLLAILLLGAVLTYLTRPMAGEAGPPKFLLKDNWQSILEATAPVGIIAIGEALVIITGGSTRWAAPSRPPVSPGSPWDG